MNTYDTVEVKGFARACWEKNFPARELLGPTPGVSDADLRELKGSRYGTSKGRRGSCGCLFHRDCGPCCGLRLAVSIILEAIGQFQKNLFVDCLIDWK